MMPRNQIMIPLFLFLLLFSTPSMALGKTVVLPTVPEEGIDTCISSIPIGNTGNAGFMFVWSNNVRYPDWFWAFSLVKFPLPPSLDTKHIVSARLELYAYAVSPSGVIVNVHRVEQEWDENSAWNDFPSLGNYPISQEFFNDDVESPFFATTAGWMSFDLTDLVKDWISDPSFNYGVLLETPYSEVPSGESRAVNMFTSDWSDSYYHPKLIIDYKETFPATIDFHPETLNLKSNGKWVTCYIEVPEDYDLENIDIRTIAITSIAMNGEEANVIENIPAEDQPTEVGDYDGDGIPDLMVKFDRGSVQERIADLMVESERQSVQDATSVVGLAKVKIKIYFEMDLSAFKGVDADSTGFEGFDEVDIIDKGK